MLGLSVATRIYLYQGAADMRCSFSGLSGLVRNGMGGDPLSGSLFVFLNRRRTLVKLLYWAGDGLVVVAKRLEKGTFRFPSNTSESAEIDHRHLMLLLEGVSPRRLHRRYRVGD